MLTTRSLESLHPPVANRVKALIKRAADIGIDVIVTCAYRDHEAQDALYAQGRTKPGKTVTNARGGQSLHQWRCAVDVAIVEHGKCVWDDTPQGASAWAKLGRLADEVGLEWAGNWRGKLRERCHFQYSGGLSLEALQSGKVPS